MQEKDDAQLNINENTATESVDMQANVTENVTAQHNFDKNLNSQNDATSQLKNAQNNAVSPLKAVYNSAQPLNNVNNTTESLGAQAERFVKSATVNFIMLVMAIFAGCFVIYTFFFQVL